MSILTWILFGMLTGVFTRLLDPTNHRETIVGSIVLGIVGAVVGATLANLVFNVGINAITLHTLSIGVSGSLILLFIGRYIKQV